MTVSKKIAIIEEMLELDEGTLNAQTKLSNIVEWDSLAAISLMVLVDDLFDRTIKGSQIKEFKTVADIIAVMEAE
jgi:acyl carrier protein